MRKLFVGLSVLAFVAPSLTLAAYNDLTLTTDAVLSVAGYTLNISGSSATIQSLTVNPTNFTVTLASGSSITISSPTLQQLSSDITSDITDSTCTGSASSLALAYNGSGTVTNTITPSAALCAGSGTQPAPAPSNGAPAGTALSAPTPIIPSAPGTTTASTSSPQLSAATQQLIALYTALIGLLEREVAVLSAK